MAFRVAPQSNIRLLKCPLTIDNKNQLDFSNQTAQYNYFHGLPHLDLEDATYVRKDEELVFDASYDDVLQYNYLMYQNESFDNKWFYAFITNKRYLSTDSVAISFHTDVFQTWYFDITRKASFVERYHVGRSSDTIGANTVPEGLETGDYICNNYQEISDFKNTKIIVACTCDPYDSSTNDHAMTGIYQNIPTGCGYFIFEKDGNGIDNMRSSLQAITNDTKESSIVAVFLAPSVLCSPAPTNQQPAPSNRTFCKKVANSYNPETLTVTMTNSVSGLNGYVPKNKKLYCYPYCYTLVTNGSGGSCLLKPELWNSYNSQKWRTYSALTPGCSVIGLPVDYAGRDLSWEDALPLGKYPQLSYANDQYINWQTQNGLNNTMTKISGIASAISGAGKVATAFVAGGVSGDMVGASGDLGAGGSQITGGMWDYASAVQQEILAQEVPPQFAGNANSGDVWASANMITYRFNYMSIRAEYAQIIDRYFEMFGYKVNKLMVPNIHTRSNWNYIKTIGCNCTGNVPQEDLQEFKNLFDRGFTVWHNPTYYLDYSQNNN